MLVLPHLPFQDGTRHPMFSASRGGVCGRATFPSIADILHDHEDGAEVEQRCAMMSRCHSHLLLLVFLTSA